MRQILQHLRTGRMELAELPCPAVGRGSLLIQTSRSLISAGTERMLVEFSKGNLLQKARAQPDKVKQVLEKIQSEGLAPTLEAVFKKLDEPLPLGYSNVGEVIEVGPGTRSVAVGDRVVSNGPHAEFVCVPENLSAKIPAEVSDEAAAFTVLGAIALQGIRLVQPTLGERVAVFGAGLIGLLTVQLLRASGCDVLAVDVNPSRLGLAEAFGARVCDATAGDPIVAAGAWTGGAGIDAAIITASAKTDEIVHQAAEMCRKRGRIVLVGVVGLNLRRADFYEKELTFQVSCSYGPGRYDEEYEQKGHDYPIGFVRWTERRNFEAVLAAMAAGRLDVAPLITDRIPLADATEAYQKILNDPAALGVLLEYPPTADRARTVATGRGGGNGKAAASRGAGRAVVAMIGAGNFAKMTMGPALAKTAARRKYVVELGQAAAARHVAQKYGFESATTDADAMWSDPELDAVFIATGHASHAALVCRGLEAGKHVFVEKPLAMNVEEVGRVIEAARAHPGLQVMVGFNRRFSPHVKKAKELLAGRSEPLAMQFTCNAGIVPPEVWVHDPEAGGGRIVGEACHFLDLLSFLAGSPIVSVAAAQMGEGVAVRDDKMSIALSFADGSVGTVNYFGNGHKAYPKESLEIYSEGRVLRLDNFRRLEGWGFRGFRRMKTRLDKGHQAQFAAFVERVAAGGPPLIPLEQLVGATLASFAAVASAAEGRTIRLDEEYGDVCR
ncbi:MAG: Gfo/Idh/MocA family oxidoreductase [Rhodopirellula sp.]|nr:Gfo/Idh/MocA family oxidoreductase [Rhodopirellula sp.]